jgi:DNA invertase Pin-like site-specific DNA recombinase
MNRRNITASKSRDITATANVTRTAIGYVRVSTDMQAADGLSLDAQREAIKAYCKTHGLRLLKICEDVKSGGSADRDGLNEALTSPADVLVVLKFDRLSRSIKHFCEMYERHFADGAKELVAIRESIRLDSALGRALVSILLVFAQMEREATGERTKEAINHIRSNGYHFGKVPYGHKAVPAPDNPRYRILVDDPEEQKVLARIKAWIEEGKEISPIADALNAEGIAPPQGDKWTKSLVYNLKVRKGWHTAKPVNERAHTDEEVKARMRELRDRGHTYKQVANILNEEGYKPYKGKCFSEVSICKLLGSFKETEVLTPKGYVESVIRKADGQRPSFPKLAAMLTNAGFLTPKGNASWWPAQVQQLLEGRYDPYYRGQSRASSPRASGPASATV